MYTESRKSTSIIKAFLSVVLVATIVLGVFSFQVSAATVRTATIDCTTGADASNTGEGWAWNNTAKTLTLTDFQFKKSAGDSVTGTALRMPADSVIVLAGNNTIEMSGVADTEDTVIEYQGSLTIKGSGSLTLSLDVGEYPFYGIYPYPIYDDSKITVTDGAKVTVNSTDSLNSGYFSALVTFHNSLTVTNGAKLTTNNAAKDSYGLFVDGYDNNGNVTVSNLGVLDVTGKQSGISSSLGKITIDNGTLTAKSTDETGLRNAGLTLMYTVFKILNGSTVTASGNFGIFSETWISAIEDGVYTGGTIEVDYSTLSLDAPAGKAAIYMGYVEFETGAFPAPAKASLSLNKSVFVGKYPALAMNKDLNVLKNADFFDGAVYVFTATPEGKPFSFDFDWTPGVWLPSNIKDVASSVRIKPQSHTLTFNTNGGSAIASVAIAEDEPLAGHVDKKPTKSGATFKGWYTDAALTKAAAPGTFYTPGMTLYAAYGVPIPPTGDSTTLWLVLTLLVMSAASIVLAIGIRKKAHH